MSLLKELHWHEGLFLCPHHLQQFQREISRSLDYSTKILCDFPYGVIEYEINNDRLINENILEFIKLKVLMPSGYIVDITNNSYLPPISVKDLIKPEDRRIILYIGLPFLFDNKANLSSKDELKNDKISRIYSITEREYLDENTGYNPKSILMRNLNPKIFSEYDDQVDYETLPIMCIKKGKLQQVVVDSEFCPTCFKVSGSIVLSDIIKKTIQLLVNHTNEYRIKLHKLLEFNSSSSKLQRAIIKLKIISSYSIELSEIFSKTDTTPFILYLKFRKLIAELSSIIPGDEFVELEEYNHVNPYLCFHKILNVLIKILDINLIKFNYKKIEFNWNNNNGTYDVLIPEKDFDNGHIFYVSIKTSIQSEYLIRSIEKGFNFKCLPSDLVKMRALPGLKLSFVSSLPNDVLREFNEYFFIIEKFNSDLWQNIIKTKTISVIEKLDKKQDMIDEISLVVHYGGKNDDIIS